MATRKSAPGKSSKASAAKKSSGNKASAAALRPGQITPYGVAIRDAMARGDAAEMRRVAAYSRKYVSDIQAALEKLDKALGK
jgi:hypothetical protein